MKNKIIKIISWVHRNWLIIFNKKSIIKIEFNQDFAVYRDVITSADGTKAMCLGNDYFKILNK